MKEKFKDLGLLLKNDRRIWAVAGFILICFMAVTMSGKERKRKPQMNLAASPVQEHGTGVAEAYRDLTIAFRQDIESIKRVSREQQQIVKRLATDIREHKKRSAGIFETVVDRLEEMGRAIDRLEDNQSVVQTASASGVGRQGQNVNALPAPPQLEAIGFTKTTFRFHLLHQHQFARR